MDWLKEYKDYFILATALATLLGFLITYIFNRSLKQQEAFYERTEESIKTIIGPMMKELKSITEEEHEQSRFRMLDQFIEQYDGITSPLFLSPSRDLLKQFDFVVQEYKIYNKNSSEENFNALWASILSLQELSNQKFDTYTDFLFRHYDWKYEAEKNNIVIRFLIYTLKFMKNIMQGLSQVVFVLLFAIFIIDSIAYPFFDFYIIKSYMMSDESYWVLILCMVFPASWLLSWLDKRLFGSKSKKKEIMKRNNELINEYSKKSPHLFLNTATSLDEMEQNASNKDDLVPNQNK